MPSFLDNPSNRLTKSMCPGVPCSSAVIGVTVSLLFYIFTIPLLQSRYTPVFTFILKLLKLLATIS